MSRANTGLGISTVAIPMIAATTAAAMIAAANCRGPQDRSATTARESEVRRRCRQDVSRVLAPPCPTITTIHSHKGRRRLDGSAQAPDVERSEEHTSELQSRGQLVCRLLLEKNIQHHH